MTEREPRPIVEEVLAFLDALQERLCDTLEHADGIARFDRREIPLAGGGRSRPRVLEGGTVVERAAVNVTETRAERFPNATLARRRELAGHSYRAGSLSAIVHPRNPYAPAAHLNLRYFETARDESPGPAWFGGGMDLTPCYGFVEDAVAWHRAARAACEPFGDDVYPRFKQQCDAYFVLPHRGGERRGIGGLFFDDLRSFGEGSGNGELARCFAFVRAVGDAFAGSYLPILARRSRTPFGERQRDFQLYRRGRYVEFNLLWDRGTRFGLEAGHATESLLASLPPLAAWRYDWRAEPGSEEAELERFLAPQDWAHANEAPEEVR